MGWSGLLIVCVWGGGEGVGGGGVGGGGGGVGGLCVCEWGGGGGGGCWVGAYVCMHMYLHYKETEIAPIGYRKPGNRSSNYIYYKVCGELTYAFPNFKGAAVEVWEWISDFTTHFTSHVITYQCRVKVNPC